MAKRKRTCPQHYVRKKPKLVATTSNHHESSPQVLHPLLAQCYPQVQNLKDYLLTALPKSSRVRRKRLLSFTQSPEHAQFFDTTLVGVRGQTGPAVLERRMKDVALFTQTCRTDRASNDASQQWSIHDVSKLSHRQMNDTDSKLRLSILFSGLSSNNAAVPQPDLITSCVMVSIAPLRLLSLTTTDAPSFPQGSFRYSRILAGMGCSNQSGKSSSLIWAAMDSPS